MGTCIPAARRDSSASPSLPQRASFDEFPGGSSSGTLEPGKLHRRNTAGGKTTPAATGSVGTPVVSTPSTATGRAFILSKRQTAFLLSISTLYGASPMSSEAEAGKGGLPQKDPSSLSSLTTMDEQDPIPGQTLGDSQWARMLPSKQGDKVRLALVSLHASRQWPPLLLSTMLATFRERRTLVTIGGERVPADLVADGAGDVTVDPEGAAGTDFAPTAGMGIAGAQDASIYNSAGGSAGGVAAGLHHSGSTAVGGSAFDISPSKKFVSALVQSLSDAARSARRGENHEEVSYCHKFSPDHDARVSASPQFSNPFYVDDPDITGERRRKRMHLRSYICTVISFADRRTEKKDINQQFFLRHPYLELRDIKLSHIRSVKTSLLQLCLSESSPIELSSIAYAAWYWERLVTALHVTKQNRKLMIAVCVTLAVKFWESGNIAKKIDYAWTKMEQLFGVDPALIRLAEFQVFAALEFTLLPPSFEIGRVYMERLLHIMNITFQEYFSRSFDLTIHWE